MPKSANRREATPRPYLPPLVRRWLRLVLGFSVSVAIGLSVYLGRARVPLFTPLLALIPESLQDIAVPLAATAMGIAAVCTQWFGYVGLSAQRRARQFRWALLMGLSSLAALSLLLTFAVVRVNVTAIQRRVAFPVGVVHPKTAPCEGLGREGCIKVLSLDEARITSYFGDTQVNATKLGLVLSYTGALTSVGWAIGLLLLAEGSRPKVLRKGAANATANLKARRAPPDTDGRPEPRAPDTR